MSTAISLKSEGDRAYLDGFRPMSWGTGEMCEFASALTRMLDCVGESVPYHYVLGVTGAAFRFTIGRELWNPGFYGFELVAEDYLDLIRRAFAAVGYAYDWHAKGDLADDARALVEQLEQFPVDAVYPGPQRLEPLIPGHRATPSRDRPPPPRRPSRPAPSCRSPSAGRTEAARP